MKFQNTHISYENRIAKGLVRIIRGSKRQILREYKVTFANSNWIFFFLILVEKYELEGINIKGHFGVLIQCFFSFLSFSYFHNPSK